MKTVFKKLLFGILISLLLLSGCKSSDNSSKSGTLNTVKVATMGTYEPFSFYDKNGKLTGFDLELVRLLEKRMNAVKFEFQAGPWDTLFPGLDTDTFQLIANQINYTPERAKKYLLTENSYFSATAVPIVRADNKSIKSLADLDGKKVGGTVGDANTLILENYNKEHGNKIIIKYYESDINSILQDIINGRLDATINDPIVAEKKAKLMGLNIKTVDAVMHKTSIFFIMKNDETGKQLKVKLDKALSEVKKDGSLSKLSTEWFGKDYTK